MKKISRTKLFDKHYEKRIVPNPTLEQRTVSRIQLFLKNPGDPVLKDHQLHGSKSNLRSFSVTGNIRVVYQIKSGEVIFIDIGTHNQVY